MHPTNMKFTALRELVQLRNITTRFISLQVLVVINAAAAATTESTTPLLHVFVEHRYLSWVFVSPDYAIPVHEQMAVIIYE